MRFFLTAKHWQIFLILFVGLFVGNFTYVGQIEITIVLRVIGLLIYFSWVLLVGHGLFNYLPKKVDFNYNLFIINFFIFVSAYTIIMILSDGDGMTFHGVAAIPMFYIGFAFLHVLTFPARVLKSIEQEKKANFGDYVVDFLLTVFWPLGIWIIQPRINQIVNERVDELTLE